MISILILAINENPRYSVFGFSNGRTIQPLSQSELWQFSTQAEGYFGSESPQIFFFTLQTIPYDDFACSPFFLREAIQVIAESIFCKILFLIIFLSAIECSLT